MKLDTPYAAGMALPEEKRVCFAVRQEGEQAYRDMLCFLQALLAGGFPAGHHIQLEAPVQKFLPIKELEKSGTHQFWAGCAQYPALFEHMKAYIATAMQNPYTYYSDGGIAETAVPVGGYALFALGLKAKPAESADTVRAFMAGLDSEHAIAPDYFLNHYIKKIRSASRNMPVLVDCLLHVNGAGFDPTVLKDLDLFCIKEYLCQLEEQGEDMEELADKLDGLIEGLESFFAEHIEDFEADEEGEEPPQPYEQEGEPPRIKTRVDELVESAAFMGGSIMEEPEEALSLCQSAIKLAQEERDDYGRGMALLQMGLTYLDMTLADGSQTQKAADALCTALPLLAAAGSIGKQGRCIAGLCSALAQLGQPGEVPALIERAGKLAGDLPAADLPEITSALRTALKTLALDDLLTSCRWLQA